MIIVRIAKVMVTAALAAFALIVAYDNIIDYDSNYEFVKHVLSMDTTFVDNALKYRAISDEKVWHAAYALIIAVEALTGLLLAFGALALLRRLRSPAEAFNRTKIWAVAGLATGFALWFFGFLVIAGEYFAMWQSKTWNGQEAAFRITAIILGVLIYVSFLSAWTYRQSDGKAAQRWLHLVFESHDGRALVPIPKRSTSPRGDIDTVAMDSLKALDLERPIREADIERLRFGASQPDAGTPFR